MSRSMDAATLAQIQGQLIYGVWIIRLDIANDPVYINTSFANLTFPGGSGYDPPLVGFTFTGAGNVGTIDPITDSVDGSQGLNLTLPGVDLTLDYLHQLVANGDLWQRRQAWVWFATFSNVGALIGKPIRMKTGRMDQMPITIDPSNNQGTLVLTIESSQSYNSEALFSRYSEQPQIDSTDLSQQYVADLANKNPGIGQKNAMNNAMPESAISKFFNGSLNAAGYKQ